MFSKSATIVWLLLVAATATSWALSLRPDAGGAGVGSLSAAAILAIAFFKVRMVVLHFMELRRAPWPWRAVFEGWVAVVCSALVVLYFVRF